MNLSLRLRTAAQWVPEQACLCDVGTDHAALPIWLMQQGRLNSAIATDIRPGPLERARRNVERYGYAEKIQLRLCNGLSAVSVQEVDTVSICGMGGNMMISILKAALWTRDEISLILQPMKSLGELRKWLSVYGYRVEEERVLWEEGHWYTLLFVKGGSDNGHLTPGMKEVGIPAHWRREENRLEYLKYAWKRLERQKTGLEQSQKEMNQRRMAYLQAALTELAVWYHDLEKGVWPT